MNESATSVGRIGIDLGGTKIEGILMAPDGAVLVRTRRPTPVSQGYEAIVAAIGDVVENLRRDAPEATVGIGTPGSVSRVTGGMKNSNTVCLNEKPLRADLESHLGSPVRIANDADCFTLSEAIDGAAAGCRVVFGVILGTGVGGGVACDGRIHVGPNGISGEWGHNVLEPDGPLCYCGQRGCVETLLSGPGLVNDHLTLTRESDRPTAKIMAERASQGDADAVRTLDRYVERLGRALASLINILDPDCIVLGGGLSGIERLYRDLPRATAPHVFNDELRTPIRRNHHGDSGGVRGAAFLW